MRSLNKNAFLLSLLITLSVIMLFSFPQISVAVSSSSNQETKPTIIAKDSKSGAVIFKKQGAYFYGFSKAKQIINKGQIAPQEFIIKYKNQKSTLTTRGQNPITTAIDKFSANTRELNSNLGLTLVQLPKGQNYQNYFKTLHALMQNTNVEYVEPNFIAKAQYIPDDPYYTLQWGPQMIRAESAWDKIDPAKLANVTIAILDSGINFNHEDLKSSIVRGYDIVNNDNNINDVVGHGTHVAGIAAAVAGNGSGIAGVAGGCNIMPVKVLGDDGSGSDADIIKGIKYATDHGAQVINLSLGGPDSSNAIQEAVNYATNHGVSVVTAAGNENGPIDTPGNCQGVITVGAIERNGMRASYSNFGPKLDVVAPGSDILSTYIGGTGPSGYTYFSGTSMAAPFVSGVIALIKAANPNLSPSEITDIIHQSATVLGQHGFSNYYGYGLINADKAVDLALKKTGTPPSFCSYTDIDMF